MKIPLASAARLAATTLVLLSTPAPAAPLAAAPPVEATHQSAAQNVQSRRGYGNRGFYERGRRDDGLGIGIGIVGAVIAGSIIAESARRNGGQSSYVRCSRAFRSFDPETGTYTSYDGETLRCPYL